MRLKADTLSEHLNLSGISTDLDEAKLIGCFLSMANSIGGHMTTPADKPLPVEMKPALLPSCFAEAVKALTRGGYCLTTSDQIAWLPKITPIMEAVGLWIDGKVAVDLRREALIAIWQDMPKNLKQGAQDPYGRVNPLGLWSALRKHWHPQSGWDSSEDYTSLPTSRWPGDYPDVAYLADAGLLN